MSTIPDANGKLVSLSNDSQDDLMNLLYNSHGNFVSLSYNSQDKRFCIAFFRKSITQTILKAT